MDPRVKQQAPTHFSPSPPVPELAPVEPVDLHRQGPAVALAADNLGHFEVLGAQPPLVAHHQLHPVGLGGLEHGVTFGHVHGHGLFAEDVLPGFGGGDGHGGVQVVGSEQGHRRRPAFLQATPARVMGRHPQAPGQGQGFLLIRIADGGDLQARKPCHQVGHVLPEAAAPHDGNRQAVHGRMSVPGLSAPLRRPLKDRRTRLPCFCRPGRPAMTGRRPGQPALTCLRTTSIMSGSVR